MQGDTLSGYPLEISASSLDLESIMDINRQDFLLEYPEEEKVYINKISTTFQSLYIENDINDEYIENVVKKIDPTLYNAIMYEYGINLNVFRQMDLNPNFYQKIATSSWSQLPETDNPEDPYDFIKTQYDVFGRLPEEKEELVLVINKYNQISDLVLMGLGISIPEDKDSFSFEELLELEFDLILNDGYYTFDGEKFRSLSGDNPVFPAILYPNDENQIIKLKVVGILRTNEETEIGSLTGAIAYLPELVDSLFTNALNSNIVTWMEANPGLDPFTGAEYLPDTGSDEKTPEMLRHEDLIATGGIKKPVKIKIFPIDFASKEAIKDYLDEDNLRRKEEAISEYYQSIGKDESTATEEEKNEAARIGKAAGIYYTDLMGVLVSSLNTLIDAISIVLIVFTSISLVVSSIMIGIITYISVLERTKEIGILRSIGARKKDIARVFNAEAVTIGLLAGLIGIGFTLLSLIPINALLKHLTTISNLAQIDPIYSLMLIAISIFLTFIAGLIPASLAAKRDPVIALRTE